MVRVVQHGTHELIEAAVGTGVKIIPVAFDRVHPAQQHAAFRRDIPARLNAETALVAMLRRPLRQACMQQSPQLGQIEAFFPPVLAIGNAEASAEIDDFQRRAPPQRFGRQIEQHVHGRQIIGAVQKQ